MEILLYFVALVIIAYLILAFEKKVETSELEHWAAAASELGAVFDPGEGLLDSPRLTYQVGDVTVLVSKYMRRGYVHGVDVDTPYVTYDVRFPSVGPELKMTVSTIGAPLMKKLGRKIDVEIGEAEFDERVVIDAPDANAVRAFLTPARRQAAMELFESYRWVRVTDESIRTEAPAPVESSAKLVAKIHHLTDVARILSTPVDPKSATPDPEL